MNSRLRHTKRFLFVQVYVGTGQELYRISLSWWRLLNLFFVECYTFKGYIMLLLFYSLLLILLFIFATFTMTFLGLKTYGIWWAVVVGIKINLLGSRLCFFSNLKWHFRTLRWRRQSIFRHTFFIFVFVIFLRFLSLSEIILDLIVVAATTFIAHLKKWIS